MQVAIPVGRLTALQQVPVKNLENGNHLYRNHEDLTGIKKTAKPYTRTQVKAEACSRNPKPLFHFLLSPQATLARPCCRV